MIGSDLITASRLSTFRECGKKHDLKYREGYRPVKIGEALRFGTLMHQGLEAWWKAPQFERIVPALGALEVEADEMDRIKAEELMMAYDTRWQLERFDEIIGVEVPFETALLNPKTWATSKTFRLAGKIDAIVKRDGRVLVAEHKSTSLSIDDESEHYFQRLALDTQISMYVIGAESLGYKVDGAIYDVIRKPQLRLKLATPEEDRKYKKDGTLYANQRELDETPEEFRYRLREELLSRPDRYFRRVDVPRMNSQISDFMYDTWATARNIRDQELSGMAPRNPDSCWKFGSPCEFWSVCAMGVDPAESSDFRKTELSNEELPNG